MGLRDRLAALLGISAFAAAPPAYGPAIDDPAVDQVREAHGGQIQQLPTTRLRWYQRDVESAQRAADAGDLSIVAQLCRAMRGDGSITGLMGTRTSGLVCLPKRFRGDPEQVEALKAETESRSVFDEMFPPSELALLATDGIQCGVGVAELVPVEGRDYPVLVRLNPEFLRYDWSEGRWYYRSIAGELPITPGDGRWILHLPGGRMEPWNAGIWRALGRAFVAKEHALLHRANYSGKLANPARAAVAPNGATEGQRRGFLQKLIAWGVNTVFELPPGWDAKLIELRGRGWEVFREEEESSDRQVMIAIAGQVVTVEGGVGFANADIHQAIRADLITTDAEALAYTINTQGLPMFVWARWGEDGLRNMARVAWDTTPPADMQSEAQSMSTVAGALKSMREALQLFGRQLDVDEVTTRFGVPVAGDEDGDGEVESQSDDGLEEDEMRVAAKPKRRALPDLEIVERAIKLARQAGLEPTTESIAEMLRALGIDPKLATKSEETAKLDLAPTDVAKVVTAREARASRGLPPFNDDRDSKTIPELEANATAEGTAEARPDSEAA